MSLNTKIEPMEDRRISLIVEVDQERVDQELRKAARTVGRQYRIPGFRKGKAPYNVVVQYVGLPNLYSEFLDSLGNEIYAQAIEQEKIEPYAMASLDISSLEPLVYDFEVPLEPTVDLGDYRSFRLEEDEPEVTPEEIEEVLNELKSQNADWAEVNRASQYGDMLTIDVRSVLVKPDDSESTEDAGAGTDADGEADEETVILDETDWDVMLDEENPLEPPGLDQELLGMSPGEEKDFVLDWPEGSQSIYAGRQGEFHVKVHTIKAFMEPELNDDFAKKIDEGLEDMSALEADITENLLESKRNRAETDYLERVLDTLVEQSTMEYPPVVVEDQIDSMVSEFARQLQMYGIDSLESYLNQVGQSMEDYRESLREQAEIAARRNLVISEVYQREGITATEEDVEERIDAMRERLQTADATDEQNQMADIIAENMRTGAGRQVLESQILQEKSLKRLLAIARGEEVPEPGAPEPKSDDAVEASAEIAAGGESETKAADAEPVAEADVAETEMNEASIADVDVESAGEDSADDKDTEQ